MGRIEITKDTAFSSCVLSRRVMRRPTALLRVRSDGPLTSPKDVVANLTAPAPTGCGDSKSYAAKRWPESQPAAKSVESG